jgi:hypothetical protein
MSRSGDLIARLWRQCRNTARMWIPLRKDEPAEPAQQPPEAPRNQAGRWPDANDLLAHRMKALNRDPPAKRTTERDKRP